MWKVESGMKEAADRIILVRRFRLLIKLFVSPWSGEEKLKISDLWAFSAKMLLFLKQSTGLFSEFTPKKA